MTFSGFGEYAIDFYDGLELDNSKAYWEDNKETYLRDVKAPMEALLADLEKEFGPGKVFRPYRDVRFAKDKTPYKTHCGGVIEKGRGGRVPASSGSQLPSNVDRRSGRWNSTASRRPTRHRRMTKGAPFCGAPSKPPRMPRPRPAIPRPICPPRPIMRSTPSNA